MRDIYKTAKQSQMAPVRGRVKAMMAQPRAVAQARKTARQTTGFQKGGHVKKVSHDSELTKWFLEQHGGTKKKKPHSTQEGRIAAGKRALWRGVEEKEKRQQQPGPQAPSRPRPKAGPAPSRPRPKAGPPAGRPKSPGGIPKKEEEGMYVKKGGVMKKKHKYKDPVGTQKPRHSVPREVHRLLTDRKGKPHSTREGRIAASKRAMNKHLEFLYEQGFSFAKPEPKKKGGKVDKKWIQKAVNPKHKGYCTPMTKKTCTPRRKALAKLFKRKAKKGWANGGTVVMPTVGNDVRVRAYKHGAVIHPRPRPTTVAHGRARGVGIAKRGW